MNCSLHLLRSPRHLVELEERNVATYRPAKVTFVTLTTVNQILVIT